FAALPIVEPALLEIRLMEILKDDRRQTRRSRVLFPLTLAAAATLTIAAARPLAMAAPPLPGPSPVLATRLSGPPAPISARAPQRRDGDLACWDGRRNGSFSGTITTSGSRVTRRIGLSGADRVIE